jgi:hypothetical protein
LYLFKNSLLTPCIYKSLIALFKIKNHPVKLLLSKLPVTT